MANQKTAVCPGCSRHCSKDHTHCNYGRKYFEGLQKKEAEQAGRSPKEAAPKRRLKWEKYVQKNGVAWIFLFTARQSKRALRSKKLTEQALLSALDEAEQAQFRKLLEKIAGTIA